MKRKMMSEDSIDNGNGSNSDRWMRKQHGHIQCRKQHEHNREQCKTQSDTAKDTAQNTADKTVYKVGIVQYVDDASLNQIEKAIEAELDAKGAELGVTFDYADHTYNGQADSSTLNQIASGSGGKKVWMRSFRLQHRQQ